MNNFLFIIKIMSLIFRAIYRHTKILLQIISNLKNIAPVINLHITRNGIYNGGIIAPGVKLSIKSLTKSADQIPPFYIKKQKKVIGKNTVEALRSGFYWGYSGLINNIILKIEAETKKKYKIIFTGGYSNLFKTSLIRSFTIDKNITINGIIEIYKKNRKYLN